MKALKTLGILVLLIVVLGLIASLILPKEVHTERSITINAPADVVWKYISTHGEFDKWSPWNKIDTAMKKELIGEDGTVGAKWKWESDNREVGKGEQEFTMVDRDSGKVETALRFEGMGDAKSWRYMSEGEDGVTVTWGMHNDHIGIPMNLAFALFWKKKMVSQFDQGLADLKELCENHKEETPAPEKPEKEYEVSSMNFPSTTYIGNKQIVKWDSMGSYFQTYMPQVGMAGGKVAAGAPSALYWSWDEENKQAEMTVAMPVSSTEGIEGFETYTVDSTAALYIDYYGDYSGSEAAHMWMNYHIQTNGMEMKGPVIEQYITDPMTEADTSKWLTKIIYLIK